MKKILNFLIIMSLSLLAGCSSGIKFNIGHDQKGGFGFKEVDGGKTANILELVSSLQELKDLCDEWGNPAFQENSEYFSSELSEKIRSYDEEYFNENILVIYSFERGHPTETRINSIEVNEEQLLINARHITRRGQFTDEAFYWLMLIEIKKADVIGVTTINIKFQ
ncbi:MAG: hypothetical protein PHY08_11300 [Candidatus Cloacimonetes bacterium]|nr:hypothetical protein [Candidatus Cloacimonadota bacterium]